MTSNEIRQVIGVKPSSDPNADVLRNKNLSDSSNARQLIPTNAGADETNNNEETGQNG